MTQNKLRLIRVTYLIPLPLFKSERSNMGSLFHCVVYGLVFLFAMESSCVALKFVIVPAFGRSHYLVLARVGKELTDRGHEVILLSS